MILEHMLRLLRFPERVGNCVVRPLVLVGKYGGGGLVQEVPDLRMLDRLVMYLYASPVSFATRHVARWTTLLLALLVLIVPMVPLKSPFKWTKSIDAT